MASALEMDPDTALHLVKKGATLLLLDVPQFTLIGIDTQVYSVGPEFKGIKMIPPGPHFIFYCSADKEGKDFAPRVGFFLTTHPTQVVVRKWHQQEERLTKVSEDEEHKYSEAVKQLELDRHLGPYNFDHYGEWQKLSNYLSPSVIERVEPIGGEITVADELELMEKAPQTIEEKRLMALLIEGKISKNVPKESQSGCYYTTIPNAVKHKHVSREELTALNIDKTKLLESILMKDYGGQEDLLLGELQFSFIAFLMGQSVKGFLQWKAIVSLLLSCSEAPLHTRTHLFSKCIKVIYFQLKHGFQKQSAKGGEGMGNSIYLDDAWFSRDIFLYRLCKDFITLVLEAQVIDGDLLSWTRKLKGMLESALGWNLEGNSTDDTGDEDDEFSPTVVPMDETNA